MIHRTVQSAKDLTGLTPERDITPEIAAQLLDDSGLTTVDVCDASGARSDLKLEGIERRPGSVNEFDVVVDADSPAAPASIGRLVLSAF